MATGAIARTKETEMQRKRVSMLEAGSHTAFAYFVAVATNYYVLPLFGFIISVKASALMAVIFAAISFVRSYLWRRLFNWLHVTGLLR